MLSPSNYLLNQSKFYKRNPTIQYHRPQKYCSANRHLSKDKPESPIVSYQKYLNPFYQRNLLNSFGFSPGIELSILSQIDRLIPFALWLTLVLFFLNDHSHFIECITHLF